jgi:thiol-disulfide isomerase/thioredoxin
MTPSDATDLGLGRRRAVLGAVSVATVVGLAAYAAAQASRVDEVDAPIPIAFAGRGGAAVAPGALAPEIAVPSLNGPEVRLSGFAGRPVWINIWASWCPPCRAELPDIAALHQELAGRVGGNSLALMLISVGEAADEVRSFVDRTRFPLPVLVDTEYRITESYRVSGLPTHFFVGADGTLRDFAIGGLKPRAMRTRVERLVGNP